MTLEDAQANSGSGRAGRRWDIAQGTEVEGSRIHRGNCPLRMQELARTLQASEQAEGIDQVGDAVQHLHQATQANAALVEQTAAAAESLKQQATHLNRVIGKFKLVA